MTGTPMLAVRAMGSDIVLPFLLSFGTWTGCSFERFSREIGRLGIGVGMSFGFCDTRALIRRKKPKLIPTPIPPLPDLTEARRRRRLR